MKKCLLFLLAAALLLGGGTLSGRAQAADASVDALTWQQASAYYDILWRFEENSPIGEGITDKQLSPLDNAFLLDYNGDGVMDLVCVSPDDGLTTYFSVWTAQNGNIISLTRNDDWNGVSDYEMIASNGNGSGTAAVFLHKEKVGYSILEYTWQRGFEDDDPRQSRPIYAQSDYEEAIVVRPKTSPDPDDIPIFGSLNDEYSVLHHGPSFDKSAPKTGCADLMKQLHARAINTDLPYAQTLAYWNVMDEISARYDSTFASIDKIWGYGGGPIGDLRIYDSDDNGSVELEVFGVADGYERSLFRELWGYDGQKAYQIEREFPYMGVYAHQGYSEAFQLVRDQLNHHWVVPASITVSVNGNPQVLGVCQAENNNYIRVRDIAMLLNGTEKSFDIRGYSLLITSSSYTPTGVEFQPSPLSSGQMCAKTDFGFLPLTPEGYQQLLEYPTHYDMTPHADAYNFNNTNFVKLRDIAKELDFYVGWDSASGTILIDTAQGYSS